MNGPSHIMRTRPGFTLIEVLFSVLIIGVLLGILIVGLRAAAASAQDNAERSVANSMATAVTAFRSEFGFLPPLVHDGDAMDVDLPEAVMDAGGESPVDTVSNPDRWYPAAYSPTKDRNFFLGRDENGDRLDTNFEIGEPWDGVEPANANQRYSKYTLSYYLVGALGSAVDGVDGPGMVSPIRTGAFQDVVTTGTGAAAKGSSSARERHGAFFDADKESGRTQRGYVDAVEYAENGAGVAPAAIPDDEEGLHIALVDRRGKAFRFYRWEHGNPNNPDGGVETLDDLNIPRVLLDPIALVRGDDDPIGTDAALKSATWAIVGAGRDGLFGTEPWAIIADELGYAASASVEEMARGRAEAQEDNLVALETK